MTITELMINEQIRDKEIRLIDENGEQLGIVSSREAQKIADERKLDLVKIAPTAKPPYAALWTTVNTNSIRQRKKKKPERSRKLLM